MTESGTLELFERIPALAVADWRRCMVELFAEVRAENNGLAAWMKWRHRRDAMILGHPASPVTGDARARTAPLPFFDYDPALRFSVGLEALDGQEEAWDIGADGILRLKAIARTRGLRPALGGELTLYWILGYGGGLFLPFADATSGSETYGGGRYLLDAVKSADLGLEKDRLLLDFNFAYNPSCAYARTWTCPLAPPENRLPGAVRGGEKAPHAPVTVPDSHAGQR